MALLAALAAHEKLRPAILAEPGLMPPLLRLLHHEERSVSVAAAGAVANLARSPALVPILLSLGVGPHMQVRGVWGLRQQKTTW